MGTNARSRFWQHCETYHDLARQYNRQVQVRYPPEVTARRLCPCLDYVNNCSWARTQVVYYEYTGPSL